MGKTYSITDLAREFDVTSRAIRFYEEQGLLSPSRRGQARVYSSGDRTRLKLILRGKRLGFTLEESRELFELYDPASGNRKQLMTMLDTINAHKNNLSQQMHDIQVMQLELDDAEQRCDRALKNNTESSDGSLTECDTSDSEHQNNNQNRIHSGV